MKRLVMITALMALAIAGSLGAQTTQVDLLVVYNEEASHALGGSSAIARLTDRNVCEVNDAFARSGVDVVVNVVGVQLVDYTETIDTRQDSYRLSEEDDGYMDEVHRLRDSLGADLVHMVCGVPEGRREHSSQWEAGAYSVILRNMEEDNQALAFSISRPGYFQYEYSLVWALSDHLGAAPDHHRGLETILPYAKPHHFTGESGRGFKSFLCHTQGGQQLIRFSNPDILHDGVPTGIPDVADNARVIREMAPMVAAYREAQGPSIHLIEDWKMVSESEGVAEFTIGLYPPQSEPVTVNFTTDDGTARMGLDHVGNTRQLRFEPGQSEITVRLPLIDDDEVEHRETVSLRIMGAEGATIVDSESTLFILDDEDVERHTLDYIMGIRPASPSEFKVMDANEDERVNVADVVTRNPPGVADIIIDNRDPDFSMALGARRTTIFNIGWPNGESDYFFTRGTGRRAVHTAAFEWRPQVEDAGWYDVSVWYVTGPNRHEADYVVTHGLGESTVRIDQRERGSRWVSLGQFYFHRGREGSVQLINNNPTDSSVIADAVKLHCVSQ